MKSNLKIKSIIAIVMIIMIAIITMMPLSTKAATGGEYSASMSLISNSKLKAGETVTISVNLTSVNAGNGIDTMVATLKYDENVFEAVTSKDLVMTNEWTRTYAASTKKFTLVKDEKVTTPEAVLTINLKVKDPVNVDSTTVTLENIVASGGRVVDGGTGDIPINNASVTISKEKEPQSSTTEPEPEKPTNSNNGNGSTGNSSTGSTSKGNSSTGSTSSSTKRDTTSTTKSTLPKAGIEEYVPFAIIGISVIAILSYTLYKKLSKDIKN